ncbi:MAG TPA: hypothetical protein EYG11_21685 [Candidatus Latescibacteria bacterium]|nr:hypothetical protein [Candidatus Handelsmanbacteria bacterium]HIL11312.1 hypothetical protein [Candidatus Latescibacterota bacterium]
MAAVLHIDDTVVTGDLLSRAHQGEREFSFVPDAILTPTAWDYIRQHRLQVSRGGEVSAATSSNEGQPETAETEGRIISEGQCEHPDRSCGCKHEEFGSGYVEPSCCHDCAIHKLKREGDAEASCEGCNRHKTLMQLVARGKASDPEELIRRISEIVAHRLED